MDSRKDLKNGVFMNYYKHIITGVVIILSISAYTNHLSAEYYQYTDEKGNICFTDNLSDIPENQRKKITSYISVEKKEITTKDTNTEPEKKDDEETDTNADQGRFPPDTTLDQIAKTLKEEKQELNTKRIRLINRQERLSEQSKKNMTPEEKIIHANNVQALNRDIESYEAERHRFSQKVRTFNKNIVQPD